MKGTSEDLNLLPERSERHVLLSVRPEYMGSRPTSSLLLPRTRPCSIADMIIAMLVSTRWAAASAMLYRILNFCRSFERGHGTGDHLGRIGASSFSRQSVGAYGRQSPGRNNFSRRTAWAGDGGICPDMGNQSDRERVRGEFQEAANAHAHHLTRAEGKNCRNGCRGWRYSPVRRCSCVPPLTASCATVSPHGSAVPSRHSKPVTTWMDLVFGLRLVPAHWFGLLRELARARRSRYRDK